MVALKYAIQHTHTCAHILLLSSEKLRSFNQLNLFILKKSVEPWDYLMVKSTVAKGVELGVKTR